MFLFNNIKCLDIFKFIFKHIKHIQISTFIMIHHTILWESSKQSTIWQSKTEEEPHEKFGTWQLQSPSYTFMIQNFNVIDLFEDYLNEIQTLYVVEEEL